MSDSLLIEIALDAARVTDDYVRGVLDLRWGRAGGDEHLRRGWRRWVGLPAQRLYGERQVVQGMAAQYAPEQLGKAARQADDLVVAVAELASAWTAPAQAASAALAQVGLREIPDILRRASGGSLSPEVRDVHGRLSRAIALLNDARAQVIVAEMRATRRDPG